MADVSCPEWAGRLVSLQGTVEVRHFGETEWQSVSLEDTFCFGDTIRVMKDSRVAVQLQNDALLRLDQETTLTFSDIENKRTYIIDLLKGAVHFFSRGSRSLKVVTPYVNAAVEGTEFEVRVTDDEAKVTLMEGRVLLENDQGEVNLAKGEVGVARGGTAPRSYVTVSPRDAVKWALYYPRVVQTPSEDVSALLYARRLIYQAGEKLSLGQVDAAEEDIDAALFLDPENGDAISLKAMIAVVNNQKDEALSLAQEAVAASPKAASARLALSYARQAAFDLEGALAVLETAVELEPDNALAWARLSELRLSLEDVSGAFLAARQATALKPDLSHTQTVLGYAYLEQVKLNAAQEAFGVAISLDSSAPLPQLGLGLTKIRQGDLTEGRRLIEVAAGLDPANSVFRSYLGKSYFEEKRDKFAAGQFAIAKELDPLDPTPWLYDAIRKQSTNRPVEALHDLQKSIELNDNRAVYRSRLQLDQDLAVRGTSLARIYNDLGFQQLGISEGRKSLSVDPANYSAHRLLADSYSALPRHEIARLSELLQAQLLQPVNIMPIQPSLSKTDLSLMETSVMGSPLLSSDFSMVTQDGVHLQVRGLAGSHSTLGDELVVSGIWGRGSFSIGQNYFSTDGFRENNDHTEKLKNAFVQYQLTKETSLQAEYIWEDGEMGDLSSFFYSESTPGLRQTETGHILRSGIHHQFAPGADFLFSLIYRNSEETSRVPYEIPGLGEWDLKIQPELENMLYEIQQQFRFMNMRVSAGAGYFAQSTEEQVVVGDSQPAITKTEQRQANVYIYTYTAFPRNVTLTLGGEYSRYDDSETEGGQFSPKFGAVWQISDYTSFHAATFRTLERMTGTNQTIEPTQVAGFNQFFYVSTGTDTWLYGVGVDHTFSSSLYGGFEYYQRDIEFPFLFTSYSPMSPPVSIQMKTDWREDTSRGYLYWTPHTWLSTALEVYYERFDRGAAFSNPDNLSNMDICRIPMSVHFFHPSGIFSGVKGTYVKQKGEFGSPDYGYTPGEDKFWTVDALFGYRLPNRLGILSLEARNIFNEQFHFQDSDSANPTVIPGRLVLGRVSFSF